MSWGRVVSPRRLGRELRGAPLWDGRAGGVGGLFGREGKGGEGTGLVRFCGGIRDGEMRVEEREVWEKRA